MEEDKEQEEKHEPHGDDRFKHILAMGRIMSETSKNKKADKTEKVPAVGVESGVMWNDIRDKWPPFIVFNEESGIEQNTITEDVIAMTEDDGEVVTYHDGDVWCYPHLSGCPRYIVTKWRPIPEGAKLIYDGRHCRVST